MWPTLAHEAIRWLAGPQEGVLQLLTEQLSDGSKMHLYVTKGWRSAVRGVFFELRLRNIPNFIASICIFHNIHKVSKEAILENGTAPDRPTAGEALTLLMVPMTKWCSWLSIPDRTTNRQL